MKRIPFLLIILILVGCKVDPNPIEYGADACHFCSMTIVDRQHAAEFVTKKGKAFKFDATECMMKPSEGSRDRRSWSVSCERLQFP